MNFRRYTHSAAVPQVTSAPFSQSEQIRQRLIRYSVAMGIRLVCLLILFVLPGWWKVLPIVGAIVLPWCAVVIANASRIPEGTQFEQYRPEARELASAGDEYRRPHRPELNGQDDDSAESKP